MHRGIFAAMSCVLLSGCTDLDKVFPKGITEFQSIRTKQREEEFQYITDFQIQHKVLNFLSRSSYSCGDPSDQETKRRLYAKKVAKIIEDEDKKVSTEIKDSLKLIDKYANSLESIKKNHEDSTKKLKEIKILASSIMGISSKDMFSSLLDPTFSVADAISNDISVGSIKYIASDMKDALQKAVKILTDNTNELTGNNLKAFNMWDNCARETLVYLRDVPLKRVGNPEVYKPYVGQSTGIELRNAYEAYLLKRNQFQSPDIKSALEKILTENQKLITDPNVDLDEVANTIAKSTTFVKELEATRKKIKG